MNLQQSSSVNRTLFKNEIKVIKTGASTYKISCFKLLICYGKIYSMSILSKMSKESAKIIHNKTFEDNDCSMTM